MDFRKVRSPRKAPQNIKRSTRQSMIVKPGESRRRRFTFDGFQKDELYSIFTLLDLDMDGHLMPEEVYVAMAAVGITPTENIKNAILKETAQVSPP